MLVGLPGCGKSTYAQDLKTAYPNCLIFSSDAYRLKLLGDMNDQSSNNLVFETLHKDMIEHLKSGGTAIYDATNVTRKNRKSILNRIPSDVDKTVHVIWTRIDECIERDARRSRSVGTDVINKFLHRWQTPWYDEGFDEIRLIINDTFDRYEYGNALRTALDILHENPHHKFNETVYEHCVAAYNHIIEKEGQINHDVVQKATLWHDVGKPLTKFFKCEEDKLIPHARYYEHHNVGGYISCGLDFCFNSDYETLLFSWLITNHMEPFFNSSYYQKLDPKWKSMIDRLHEADLAAH